MAVHYVPAGAEIYAERRVQILVSNKPNNKEASHHGKLYKKWLTLDKTVSVVATSNRAGVCCPMPADVVVPILNPTFIQTCGLTKVLANPIHGVFDKAAFEHLGIESIVDSGGFQMLRGTVDFVDPDNLIKLYKKDANIGMPLDLPVPSAAEPFFFDAVSKMIRANDRYMEPKLKGIDLALISHGSTLARRKARLDVLDRDDAKVIAIAGLNIKPEPGTDHLMAFCENLMYVIHRFHKTARYFHVLGVTSKFWLFIYALLDASGYVKNIGADSVSHRLGSLTGMYDTQDFNSVYLPKDRKFKQPLPCSCPVCFALDDMRLMQYYVLLEAHNLWTRAHWVKLLSEMAKRYVAGQLPLKEVHEVLRLRMSINDLTLIIKYIESIIETDKFKPIRVQGKSRSLFATQTPKKSPKHDLYIKILQSYEKFHGIKLL